MNRRQMFQTVLAAFAAPIAARPELPPEEVRKANDTGWNAWYIDQPGKPMWGVEPFGQEVSIEKPKRARFIVLERRDADHEPDRSLELARLLLAITEGDNYPVEMWDRDGIRSIPLVGLYFGEDRTAHVIRPEL